MSTNKTVARIRIRNAARAQGAIAAIREDIDTQIRRIQAALAANPGADWADVGDFAYVLENVKAAADFINGTNDEDQE